MKPTTEQILSALNEMIQSKTELKSERVELGDVDRLMTEEKQLEKELKSAYKHYGDVLEKAAKYKEEIKRYRNELVSKSATMEDTIKKIEKAAKDLGVSENDIPALKDAQKKIAESGTFIKSINKRWL